MKGNMKAVVTGGAGFIGSHIVEALLARGDEVVVIDDFSSGRSDNLAFGDELRSRLTVHRADVAEPATAAIVRDARPDALLLLAAQPSVKVSMRDPMGDARTNVIGLINMLEAARAGGSPKVVIASSGGTIYGPAAPESEPVTEQNPHHPMSFYGLTKSLASSYLRLYHEQFGLESAALALGNVYGPRQPPDGEFGVIAIFSQRMLDGMPCVVNGDGLTTRDYVHVSDVVAAFLAAAEHGNGLFNVGTGVETSVLDIHWLLAEKLGIDREPDFSTPLDGEVRRVWLDVTRSREELGWSARIPLSTGVDSVITWLRGRTDLVER
jgi:UDP-glucose 4-epimerase